MDIIKENDYVMWRDIVSEICYGRVVGIRGRMVEILDECDDIVRLSIDELTYLPPVVLDGEKYRSLLRLDIPAASLFDGNITENFVNADGYRLVVEDLLYAIEKLRSEAPSPRDMELWLDLVYDAIMARRESETDGVYTESDALFEVYRQIAWADREDADFDSAYELGKSFIEDRDKAPLKRRYPLFVKENFLAKLDSDEALASATDDEVALYRAFVLELCEAENTLGLRAVGYGCYGGNRAFECDWERSRDCIARLFELETSMPERAFLANTLGYIYYYGRTNGGVPDYASAYKYFSFAAFNGVYEAKYKVADMYKNGLGVVKCRETSRGIIEELYSENIKYIASGELNSKFADVALRMGSMFKDDENEELVNYDTALYYLMQADYAIRMRMSVCDYYGDAKVCQAISKALEDVKKKLEYKPKSSIRLYNLQGLLAHAMSVGPLAVTLKRQKDLRYKMTVTALKRPSERGARKLFITVPELDLCGLYDKLTLVYEARCELDDSLLNRAITVDEIDYSDMLCMGNPVIPTRGDFILRRSSIGKKEV